MGALQRGRRHDPLRNGAVMALTNAERQARHRERMKEKLRNASQAEPLRNDVDAREQMAADVLELLGRAYYGQAETFRKQISGDHIDGYVEGAIGEFMAERVSFDDVVKIVELAGYARLGKFFELHCLKTDMLAPTPEWIQHKEELAQRGVT